MKSVILICIGGEEDARFLRRLVLRAWGSPLSPIHAEAWGAVFLRSQAELDGWLHTAPADVEVRCAVVFPMAATWLTPSQAQRVDLLPREKIDPVTGAPRWRWLLDAAVQWTEHPLPQPIRTRGDGAREVKVYGVGESFQSPFAKRQRGGRAGREWKRMAGPSPEEVMAQELREF